MWDNQRVVKKSDFDPPFCVGPQFLSNVTNKLLIHDADKKQTHCKKTKRKNIGKCQNYAPLNFGRHLGHQTPF
jgi:hypothetical protein